MLEIHIDDAEARATLNTLQHRLENPGVLMRNIATLLESQAQEAFRQEGPGWKPLALATIRRTRAFYRRDHKKRLDFYVKMVFRCRETRIAPVSSASDRMPDSMIPPGTKDALAARDLFGIRP